jgi:putative ABC transport system permease protein
MRAMGASNTYIYKVIICQALLNAVIGFAIAALIGTAIAISRRKARCRS